MTLEQAQNDLKVQRELETIAWKAYESIEHETEVARDTWYTLKVRREELEAFIKISNENK